MGDALAAEPNVQKALRAAIGASRVSLEKLAEALSLGVDAPGVERIVHVWADESCVASAAEELPAQFGDAVDADHLLRVAESCRTTCFDFPVSALEAPRLRIEALALTAQQGVVLQAETVPSLVGFDANREQTASFDTRVALRAHSWVSTNVNNFAPLHEEPLASLVFEKCGAETD